ncbi:hypothetical protein GCM10027065_24910 [Rhodanobacter koreensis]
MSLLGLARCGVGDGARRRAAAKGGCGTQRRLLAYWYEKVTVALVLTVPATTVVALV